MLSVSTDLLLPAWPRPSSLPGPPPWAAPAFASLAGCSVGQEPLPALLSSDLDRHQRYVAAHFVDNALSFEALFSLNPALLQLPSGHVPSISC